MSASDICQWGVVLGASLAAAITDATQGRIPNVLTLPLWLAGLVQAACGGGIGALGAALGVSVLLALPYVASFLFGRGGAGDAKLMAGLGAWLSLCEGVIVFCCVALTGMLLAILKIAAHRERKNILSGLVGSSYVLAATWAGGAHGRKLLACIGGGQAQEHAGQVSLPYGVVIFLGVCSAAVGVRIWA